MTPEGHLIQTMFRIPNKEQEEVDFVLNSTQFKLDANMGRRNLVAKARQEGVSAYVLARFTVACLTKPNTRAVVISHERSATERMLNRVHGYLDTLRGPKPVLENASKAELTFPKTGSMFFIGTAGAKKFGRGDTITHFHGSEVAFWDNPKDLISGALQAVPMHTGEVFLESTANGAGTWWHRTVTRAAEAKGQYKLHFFDWKDFPEYTIKMSPVESLELLKNLNREFEEPELVRGFSLTPGQIAFRRAKLEEMDFDLDQFRQEYPLTIDEGFIAAGNSFFRKTVYIHSPKWEELEPHLHGLVDHPYPEYTYFLGADPSGGVGGDDASIHIGCIETNEQVAEYSFNKIGPDHFGRKIAELGRRYNSAYAVVESNNHGITTLDHLSKDYSYGSIHRDKKQKNSLINLGYRTTERSKAVAAGLLRTRLRAYVLHSTLLRNELSTYVEDENGKLGAQEGANDDRVMALMMAHIGLLTAAQRASITVMGTPLDQVAPANMPLGEVMAEYERNLSGGFPISDQQEESWEGRA